MKSTLISEKQFLHILKSTLIFKATHKVNLEFKVDLKSTLIKKNSSEVNLDFKLEFFISEKFHTHFRYFTMSHS